MIHQLKMELWDFKRSLDSGFAMDRWLVDQVAKAQAAVKAAPAPAV
jgi:hypothetical protein